MTLFNQPNTQQSVTSQDQNNDDGSSYLERLVGDGKKFKDPEALARGKWESDNFVAQMQREAQLLREELARKDQELQTRISIEEALAKITSHEQAPPTQNNQDTMSQGQNAQSERNSGLTQEQLDELLERKLNQRQAVSIAERNIDEAKQAISRTWGNNAQEKLLSALNELGMSKEEADLLASRNPKAFLRAIGANVDSNNTNTQANTNHAPPRTQVNTQVRQSSGNKDAAYYAQMAKTDMQKYLSKETQLEMYRAAMANPEAFLSK